MTEHCETEMTAPDLPPLVLQVVGQALPQRSVAACRLVCRQWRSAFSACVEVVTITVDLDPALTEQSVAAAAAAFPAATQANLVLPNCLYARFNAFDAAGSAAAAARGTLGRRMATAAVVRKLAAASIAGKVVTTASLLHTADAKLAPLPEAQAATPPSGAAVETSVHPAGGVPAAEPLRQGEGPYGPPLAPTVAAAAPLPAQPDELGRAACCAALLALRTHMPSLRRVQMGDAQRPATRLGPLAALKQCCSPSWDAVGACPGSDGGGGTAPAPFDVGDAEGVEQLHCASHVTLAASEKACRWSYPATLVPPEGAVCWPRHQQEVAQHAAEQAVAAAHRAALDLTPLLGTRDPPPQLLPWAAATDAAALEGSGSLRPPPPPLARLSSLDLRCAVDVAALAAPPAPLLPPPELTSLTVLQLRDGAPLAALRHLPGLASLDLWCCEGSSLTDLAYWTSAAPQRIRRGLTALPAVTGLTALVLRELAAQVEPPPPVAALAALPLLRSLTLELVYAGPWRQLAELCEQLGQEEEEGEVSSIGEEGEGSEEESSSGGQESGTESEERPREGTGRVEPADHRSFSGSTAGPAGVATATAAAQAAAEGAEAAAAEGAAVQRAIDRDVALLDCGGSLRTVIERGWATLDEMRPGDLFSCFGPPDAAMVDAADGPAGHDAATAEWRRVGETHGSLTHLDVTFVGAGLLPGAWYGICRLGGSLTDLAMRVERSEVEERLVARLLSRLPKGRWRPDSFQIDSLASLPRLRHLTLDAPLQPTLAASLGQRAGRTQPPAPAAVDAAAAVSLAAPAVVEREAMPRVTVAAPSLRSLQVCGLRLGTAGKAGWDPQVPAVVPCLGAGGCTWAADGGGGSSGGLPPPTLQSCCGAPPPALAPASMPLPPPAVPPPPLLLQVLHLEGDLSGLAVALPGPEGPQQPATPSRSAAAELSQADVRGLRPQIGPDCWLLLQELRLCHRPAGRPALRRLPLRWSQLPGRLEALQLEGFVVVGGRGMPSPAARVEPQVQTAPASGPGERSGSPQAPSPALEACRAAADLQCQLRQGTAQADAEAVRQPAGAEAGGSGWTSKCLQPAAGGAGVRAGGSEPLCRLERLRLRHCHADLRDLRCSPLAEVAVQGCWLGADRAAAGPAPAGTSQSSAQSAESSEFTAVAAPWHAAAQLELLSSQPWSPRLVQLELQLTAAPASRAAAAAARGPGDAAGSGGPEGFCGDGGGEGGRTGGQGCWRAHTEGRGDGGGGGGGGGGGLCSLEHLSVSWELAALLEGRPGVGRPLSAAGPQTQVQAQRGPASSFGVRVAAMQAEAGSKAEAEAGPGEAAEEEEEEGDADAGPLVALAAVGLTPAAAERMVCGLPRLRSLELYLGDRGQGRPLQAEDAMWLLRLRGLRRLRLLLCVSASTPAGTGASGRGAGDSSVGGSQPARAARAGTGDEVRGCSEGAAESERGDGGATGRVMEAQAGVESRGPGGDSGVTAAGGFSAPASAWLHSELGEMLLAGLPHCQSQVVQVRVA